MPDFGNTSVFFQDDASNNSGTAPSWSGSAAPSTLDNSGRALQGAVTREWNWRSLTLTATGTADAKVLTYSTAPAALYNGQIFGFIANTTNTGACTLNINSLGAKAIKKDVAGVLTALAASDMPSGSRVLVSYNSSDDSFCWINWQGSTLNAATASFVLDGTSTVRYVTPDALAALWEAGSNITDGAAITIGEGGYFQLNASTTAITSFVVTNDKAGRTWRCRFNTARTLTHNATSLILPGAANITTVQGDIAQFRSLGSGNVVCEWYTRASGLPLVETASITSGTAQASTSGTTVDFTSIPSGVKRIVISFSGVSVSGTSNPIIQLGDSGGVEATAYRSYSSRISNNGVSNGANYTTGFGIASSDAAAILNGSVTLTLLDAATFTWSASGFIADSAAVYGLPVSGAKALSATLDRVRITTVGGTDTFDAGLINIMYE